LLLATLKLLRFAKHLTQIINQNQVLLWVPKTEWVCREIARDCDCTQKQPARREQDGLSHVLLIDNRNLGGVRLDGTAAVHSVHLYEVRATQRLSRRRDAAFTATHFRPGVIDFRHGGHGVPRHYHLDQLVFRRRRNY
jgi:hypothetical protein